MVPIDSPEQGILQMFFYFFRLFNPSFKVKNKQKTPKNNELCSRSLFPLVKSLSQFYYFNLMNIHMAFQNAIKLVSSMLGFKDIQKTIITYFRHF